MLGALETAGDNAPNLVEITWGRSGINASEALQLRYR